MVKPSAPGLGWFCKAIRQGCWVASSQARKPPRNGREIRATCACTEEDSVTATVGTPPVLYQQS